MRLIVLIMTLCVAMLLLSSLFPLLAIRDIVTLLLAMLNAFCAGGMFILVMSEFKDVKR